MQRFYQKLLYLLIGAAFLLRLSIFLQARDLFIDEANVARNLYEKSYVELLQPLDYEQFAPPLFLCISKVFAEIFGYTEMALRLLPFLCSIVSIFLLAFLIKERLGAKYGLYPIALFGSAHLFIHYATELKQYSGDFMITLILLVFALKTANKMKNTRVLLLWVMLGSFALWFSMPAVFILFSIGVFWVWNAFWTRDGIIFIKISTVLLLWLAQFAFYYFWILQNQISSNYLQDYHFHSFLLLPWKYGNLIHDIKVISGIITQAGGFKPLAIVFTSFLVGIGIMGLLLKEKSKSILFILPFGLLFAAALLNKYALVDRLVLFIQPITYVFMAYGVYVLWGLKTPVLRLVMVLVMLYNVYQHQQFKYLTERFEFQEICQAFELVEKGKLLKGNYPFWVHHGAYPAFVFYTNMSPKADRYNYLTTQAVYLDWDSDYNKLSQEYKTGDRFYVLITNFHKQEQNLTVDKLPLAKLLRKEEGPGFSLLLFEKK